MANSDDKRVNRSARSYCQSDVISRLLELDECLDLVIQEGWDVQPLQKEIRDFVRVSDSVTIDETNDRIIIESQNGYTVELSFGGLVNTHEAPKSSGSVVSDGNASVPKYVGEENAPPKRAEMLLHFGLPKRDRECMIGDLEEEYRTVILPKYGPRVAARWYWWQAVRSVVVASGGRVRAWLSFGGLARAAGWIVEKFTL
jgi:hypothetical protein